jgi:transposase-like protein
VAKQRKRISPEKKVEILREILENNRTITDVAEQYDIHPNIIGRWKKQLFEGAVQTFVQEKEPSDKKSERKIRKLEDTLQKRDTLIAELVSENIELKKNDDGVI